MHVIDRQFQHAVADADMQVAARSYANLLEAARASDYYAKSITARKKLPGRTIRGAPCC